MNRWLSGALAGYYVLIVIFLLLGIIFAQRKKLVIYQSIFMAALPFSGMIILLFSTLLTKNRTEDTELFASFKDQSQPLFWSERERERNITSIRDVLSFNDVHTKRDVVMGIFRADSEEYTPELRMAMRDPDSEVSLYASAALTEIKRKHENQIYLMRERAVEGEMSSNYRYAHAINQYLLLDIIDHNSKIKLKRIFCTVMLACYQADFLDTHKQYPYISGYFCDLGDDEEALDFARQYLKKYETEQAYYGMLKLCYRLNRREEFFKHLDALRQSAAPLTGDLYQIIGFFAD